jgi:alcohol dehydrogenase
MDRAVAGSFLLQFESRTSIIHAFGHAFSQRYDLQQGVAHAVAVPHVLEYLFAQTDASRVLLAEGLGVEYESVADERVAEAIIERVLTVRDSLDLPRRLRDIGPVRKEDLPVLTDAILHDSSMDNAPADLEPTADEIRNVLENAW